MYGLWYKPNDKWACAGHLAEMDDDGFYDIPYALHGAMLFWNTAEEAEAVRVCDSFRDGFEVREFSPCSAAPS